jgi:SAM-dependent methyltransferase
MLACGLPCVELAGRAIESVYGPDGPIELAAADPIQIADALEHLLDDPGLRARRSAAGLEFTAPRTWELASLEVENALRKALWEQEVQSRGAVEDEGLLPPVHGPVTQASADSARAIPMRAASTMPVTDRLYERLAPEDVEAVEARLEGRWRSQYLQSDAALRRSLAVILGAYYEVPAVLEKTGLSAVQPPDDVHAMARGPLAGGGSLYYADMLEDTYRRLGGTLDDVRRGLDFGCSSGRVVRALHAAFPQAEWHGVDPNREAIAWAREHLPGIAFDVSPQDPPLPFPDAHFDFVVAISIWSHYAEPAARRWLDEMHRVIAPGGRLLFSTHGLHSISHYAQTGERSPKQLAAIRRALYQRDHWFAPEFGEEGDWGVKHTEWGTAFFTPEWLARVALPAWIIEDFAVGQNADNQDMYVLRRR